MPKATVPKSREPLTRARAVASAMALADAEGLGALTMRRLAESLGVEAMSIYHHLANKDEILDAMVDTVFNEIAAPSPGTPWRTEMVRRAHAMRAALLRHRWALTLMESRTSPGIATLRHHNAVLGCLRQAGFSVILTAHAYAALDNYIYGFVMQELNLPLGSLEENAEFIQSILRDAPIDELGWLIEFATSHVLQPGYDFGDEFDYGLALILDGLEAAFARESPAAPGERSGRRRSHPK